jgi:hypothetical protein
MLNDDFEKFLSWARYLYWAERLQRDLERYYEVAEETVIPEWLGVHIYFAASLYVVIEGWESLKYKDPIIEILLQRQDWKATLRRLRNGTFHYQPSLRSEKLSDFIKNADVPMWLWTVHDEFCRYFKEWLEKFRGFPGFNELHKDLASMVGFIPEQEYEDKIQGLQAQKAEMKAIIESGKASSEFEMSFRKAIGEADSAIKRSREMKSRFRTQRLLKLGVPLS